jgi:hypothetical protein
MATSSSTLNPANYTSVWSDDFTQGYLPGNMVVAWGDSGEFAYSSAGLALTSDGNASGFMTADAGPSSGDGYGLYSVTFTAPSSEANGAYICMWPGSNVWPGPELDFYEQMGGNAYMTVHWAGADGSNQYQSDNLGPLNTSQPTTMAMDWEKGSLTFYLNGQEVQQYVAGGAVPIPRDYADGGENESFGAGNVGPAGTTLTVSAMSYSTLNSGTTVPTATTTTTTTSTSTSTSTPTSTWIAISNPGTVTAASAGAPVTVQETVSAPGLSTIYEATFTSAGTAEANWAAVTLDASGNGSFAANFANSGDYVVAVSNTSTDANESWSSPITITAPTATTSTTSTSTSGTTSTTTPTTTTTTTTSTSAGSVLTLSAADVNNQLVLTGIKADGQDWTVKWSLDGHYEGTLKDNMPDGSFTFTEALPTPGTHNVVVYLDSTNIQASASVTVPTATTTSTATTSTSGTPTSTSTSGTTSTTTPTTATTTTTSTSAGSVLTLSAADVNNQLVLTGTKADGQDWTVKWSLDGQYKGTLADNMPDGSFIFTEALPAPGAHNVVVYLDSTNVQASASVTVPTATTSTATTSTPTTVTVNTQTSYTTAITGQTIQSTLGSHTFFLNGANETLTATGGKETVTANGGSTVITTGAYADTITLNSSGNTGNAGAGANTVIDNGTNNTLILPAAGAGTDTIKGAVFSNGDVFDLRAAMAATKWDGQASDLGSYLSVRPANSGQDLKVLLSASAGGAGTVIATLAGQGSQTLASFEQHARFV